MLHYVNYCDESYSTPMDRLWVEGIKVANEIGIKITRLLEKHQKRM